MDAVWTRNLDFFFSWQGCPIKWKRLLKWASSCLLSVKDWFFSPSDEKTDFASLDASGRVTFCFSSVRATKCPSCKFISFSGIEEKPICLVAFSTEFKNLKTWNKTSQT